MKGGPRAHGQQGRPLGYLLRWLELGPTCHDKKAHDRIKSDIFAMALPERQRLRRVAILSNFAALALERPLTPGEDPEPFGLC